MTNTSVPNCREINHRIIRPHTLRFLHLALLMAFTLISSHVRSNRCKAFKLLTALGMTASTVSTAIHAATGVFVNGE